MALSPGCRSHQAVAALLVQKTLQRLRGDLGRGVTAIDPNELDGRTLARMADIAVKIDRLAHELPTEGGGVLGHVSHAHFIESLPRKILDDPVASRALDTVIDRVFALDEEDDQSRAGAS